jgi:AcrR family transcriptional regulator
MHKTYRPHLASAQDERAVRTRGALRRAMMSLLETHSMNEISMQGIADASGLAYTTVTRHYPSKVALINDLAAVEMRRLVDVSAPAYQRGETKAASLAFCAAVLENRALWSKLLSSGAVGALREEYIRISQEVAASRGQGDWPLADIGLILMAGGAIDLLAWWLRQKRPMPLQEIAEIYDELVVAPPTEASRRRLRKAAGSKGSKPPRPGTRLLRKAGRRSSI